MSWSAADYSFMSRALQLAGRGRYTTHPNPRVGCVLAREGGIIAEGWHVRAGEPHAEVNAIRAARESPAGSVCYVTLEPCSHTGRTPPCTEALIQAGVKRIITAMTDPFPEVAGQGLGRLEQHGMAVSAGLLEAKARQLNRGYINRWTEGRPFVTCKLAVSLDGRTAMASGESKWITGAAARRDVQSLRAASSAIMTGIGTVLADDPGLDVRDIDTAGRQPLRVVIDPELDFPVAAGMLRRPGRTLIVTGKGDTHVKADALRQAGAEMLVMDPDAAGFLDSLLQYLAGTEAVNDLLVEAGATLAGSMLSAGLIHELVVYQAPLLMGDAAKGLFHLPAVSSMMDRITLERLDCRMIGKDMRLTFRPVQR